VGLRHGRRRPGGCRLRRHAGGSGGRPRRRDPAGSWRSTGAPPRPPAHHDNPDCNVRLDAPDGEYRSAYDQSRVRFQHKHWFDAYITIDYLKWLKVEENGSPECVIGLIWDMAPAHMSGAVAEYIKANSALENEDGWLVIGVIPGGLTSILQPCDLVINADFKRMLKVWYSGWRRDFLRDKPTTGHIKIKMDRHDLIMEGEKILDEIDRSQLRKPVIADCFRKCGFDWAQDLEDPSGCTEEELFAALPEFAGWVNGLSEIKLYASLTQSLNFASDDSAISDHLEQAALEEEVERLALDDESSDDGLGGSNEDDSE